MQKSNNKLSWLLAGLAALLVLVVAAVFVVNNLPQDTDIESGTNQVETAVSDESRDIVRFTASANGSALEQLQAVNDSVVVVESELGSYVDSINGLSGGSDGKYWSFYVDGEMAQVGAGQYQPKGGEVIEWKFQKL